MVLQAEMGPRFPSDPTSPIDHYKAYPKVLKAENRRPSSMFPPSINNKKVIKIILIQRYTKRGNTSPPSSTS